MIKPFLKFIRIKHWIKNGLIFLPVFFGGKIKDFEDIKILIFVFLYFSVTASLVYIMNDLFDLKKDKLHSEKKNRALPSGLISKKTTYLLIIFMAVLLLITSIYLPVKVVVITCVYFVINILYSVYLKTVPIIELFIVAIGFILRILVGSYAVSVVPSKWIIMLTFFAALYIILSKRRCEVLNKGAYNTRVVLKSYSEPFLTAAMVMALSINIVAYIMYTVEDKVIQQFGTDKIYITSIFVVFAMFRHLQQTLVFNRTEDPVAYILKDKLMLLFLVLWLFTFYYLIYIV